MFVNRTISVLNKKHISLYFNRLDKYYCIKKINKFPLICRIDKSYFFMHTANIMKVKFA